MRAWQNAAAVSYDYSDSHSRTDDSSRSEVQEVASALGTLAWQLADDDVPRVMAAVLKTADSLVVPGEQNIDPMIGSIVLIRILEQRLPFPPDVAAHVKLLYDNSSRIAREHEEKSRREHNLPPLPPEEAPKSAALAERLAAWDTAPAGNPRKWLLEKVNLVAWGSPLETIRAHATEIAAAAESCSDDSGVLVAIASLLTRRYGEKTDARTIDDYDDAVALFARTLPSRLTRELQRRLEALIAVPAPAPADVHLLLAMTCAKPAASAAVHVLTLADDPRDLRLAAAALAQCGAIALARDTAAAVERNVERLFRRARTTGDVERLIKTTNLMALEGERWKELVWNSLASVVIAHPDASYDDLERVLRDVPPPTIESAADFVQLPMLDYDLEYVALQQVGRLARTFFVDHWDFIDWWAARSSARNPH